MQTVTGQILYRRFFGGAALLKLEAQTGDEVQVLVRRTAVGVVAYSQLQRLPDECSVTIQGAFVRSRAGARILQAESLEPLTE